MNTENLHLSPAVLRAITLAVRAAIGNLAGTQSAQPPLMRTPELVTYLGVSKSTIRNYLDKNGRWFDPDFPQPIRLGHSAGKRSAIGWRRADIDAWIRSRPTHHARH